MAFCPNCGSQVQGAFCPNCGTSMAAGAAPGATPNPAPDQGAYAPNPGAYAPPPTTVAATGIEPHIASALCYTPFAIGLIASIIFIVAAPYNQNKFIRFSAFQSLFLHLGIFLLFIALSIVATIVSIMIHLLGALFLFIWPLAWLGTLILFLFMMYKSFNNQKVKLPFIGDLAEKQA
jgi:uncharacterized membrane protein